MFVKIKKLFSIFLQCIHHLQKIHPNTIVIHVDSYQKISDTTRQNFLTRPTITIGELSDGFNILRRVETDELVSTSDDFMRLGAILIVLSVPDPKHTVLQPNTFTLKEIEQFGVTLFTSMIDLDIDIVEIDEDRYYALCTEAWNDFESNTPAYEIRSIKKTLHYIKSIVTPQFTDLEHIGNLMLLISDEFYRRIL